MTKYKADYVRRMIAQYGCGWRPNQTPMTDAKFEQRYDPQTYWDRKLIETLENLTDAIRCLALDFQAQPERPWHPSQPIPPVRPLSGPVEIQR